MAVNNLSSELSCMPQVVKLHENRLTLLDQSVLPYEEKYIECLNHDQVVDAISKMLVRGAPAIGCAGAAGMYLACRAFVNEKRHDNQCLIEYLGKIKEDLDSSRPTAVNLMWATSRCLNAAETISEELKKRNVMLNDRTVEALAILKAIRKEVEDIFAEDLVLNKSMGDIGARTVIESIAKKCNDAVSIKNEGMTLIDREINVLHHCNTGHLATTGYGTALGVIYRLHEHQNKVHVYVDETRPRLQGAKLTCWELNASKVPHTLIVDGASSLLMLRRNIDAILFGADRCAANGDVANKIGTCNLAISGHAFNVPRFACVPTSTIDLTLQSGDDIVIEERSSNEVTDVTDGSSTVRLCPPTTKVWNPAFDVTPNRFISAIITEVGVIWGPDFGPGLRDAKIKAQKSYTPTREQFIRQLCDELLQQNVEQQNVKN